MKRKPAFPFSWILDLRVFTVLAVIAVFTYAAVGHITDLGIRHVDLYPVSQTNYLPVEVKFVSPQNGDNVTNPVVLRMAVSGVLFEPSTVPAKQGQGHLLVTIDGSAPAPGSVFKPDASHIDLSDGSHVMTLPPLSLGEHTLMAVWGDSNDVVSDPIYMDTIHIAVTSFQLP